MSLRPDGYWGMHCWNGLSTHQQGRLIKDGNLEMGFRPEGWCDQPAQVEIETEWDAAPGPRFLCLSCAVQYLQDVERSRRSSA